MDIEEITKEELQKLIDETDDYSYGLPVICFGGDEYIIAQGDDYANNACKEYIEDSLWAFSECFMSDMTGIDLKVFVAFSQSNLCESANEAIKCLVEQTCGIDAIVERAIDCDGRGHFLSPWDGEEIELNCGGYAYRLN